MNEALEKSVLELSNLSHTWLIDLDGTILKHNGYKADGDILLSGAKDFFNSIPSTDKVILLTSRETKYKDITEKFLKDSGINYNEIIYDLPFGERILINDRKNSGLLTAYAINKTRDEGLSIEVKINENL